MKRSLFVSSSLLSKVFRLRSKSLLICDEVILSVLCLIEAFSQNTLHRRFPGFALVRNCGERNCSGRVSRSGDLTWTRYFDIEQFIFTLFLDCNVFLFSECSADEGVCKTFEVWLGILTTSTKLTTWGTGLLQSCYNSITWYFISVMRSPIEGYLLTHFSHFIR